MLKWNSILLVAIALNPIFSHAADKVYPKSGVPASGQIKSISPARVVITVRGKEQTYELGDVEKITFDGEPGELQRAREQFINGQFDQALEEIKKADPSTAANAAIRQDIIFYRWYCEGKEGLSGKGDMGKAAAELQKFAAANRQTHHLVDIFTILGELNIALGNPDNAVKFFQQLTKAPSPATQLYGKYQLGMVDLAKNATADAKTKFTEVSKQKSESEEMARVITLAKVGLAVCVQRGGDNEGALKQLNQLASATDDTDHDLFGRISNARGQCYKAQGNTVYALQDFLLTDLLCFTAAQPHAEALYELQSLWAAYGNPTKAADAKKRLKSQYASSVWANKP
ncbi:MAG: hypothetical protein AAF483_27580 [Planctomycetota bacterium]